MAIGDIRGRLMTTLATSLIGLMVTFVFHFCVKHYRGAHTDVPVPGESATAEKVHDSAWSSQGSEYNRLEYFIQRYYKIIAMYLLLVFLETVKGVDQGNLSLLRVMKLESFRETLRGIVQGRGLPPMPTEGAVGEHEDVAREVEYANAWLAKKQAAASKKKD